MAELPPGIGNDQQAMQATAFIRQQPWYHDWLQSQGIQEGSNQQVKLNENQQLALNQTIREHGIGMNSKYDGIDENGMIYEEHHKLKKALIAAAIGGLALTGFGAAGIGPMAGMMGGSAALGGTTTAASMSGLGSGIGTLVPATTGLAGLGAAGAGAGIGAAAGGAAAAGGTLAALGSSAIPAVSGIGALVPATTSSLAGLGAAAGGAGAAAGGAAAGGGSAAGGTAPLATTAIPGGTGIGSGAVGSSGIGSLVPATTSSLAGGGSTAGGLLSKFTNSSNLSDLSKTVAGYTQGQKADRIVQGEATNLYDKNMLQAQQDRNANETDAMKKLQQTSYLMGGGSHAVAPSFSLNGKSYQTQDFGFTPQVSDATKAGASTLQAQLQQRLAPGGSYTPNYSQYGATPGTGEQIGDIAGPIMSGIGTIANMYK